MNSFSKGAFVLFWFSLTLVAFSFSSITTKCYPSSYKPPTNYNKTEVDAYIAKIDSQFNSLGFKGLHLGMTKGQVNDLVVKTPWGYSMRNVLSTEYRETLYNRNWPDKPQSKDDNFLKGDESLSGATWAKIGCEGPKGEGSCYWIRDVFIRYFNDKLTEISLLSPTYSADKIDSMVKDWGSFALKGLIKKYGNPTRVNKPIEKVNVFTFKSGYDFTLYEWVVGPEKIKLTMGEYESKFGCTIKFQNPLGINKIEENRSKSVSDF